MKYITWDPEYGARMGHQTTGFFNAHILAARHGCKVIHVPFGGNAASWEKELDLGDGDLSGPPRTGQTIHFRAEEEAILDRDVSVPTVFLLAKNSNVNDTYSGRDIYRARYYAKERKRQLPEDGRPNIAIHLRRGDVTKLTEPGRWLPEEPYLNLIERLRGAYKDARFYIFSEGERISFVHFERKGCEIRTDLMGFNEFDTFHSLVQADVLVGSKSAYPYYAGMLSNGIVIMPPFWHSYPSEGLWAPSVKIGTNKWYTMEV